jgi:hypothetical protein
VTPLPRSAVCRSAPTFRQSAAATPIGRERTLAHVGSAPHACEGRARRGRRYPPGAHAGAVGPAGRLPCDARAGVASRNSLRSLRSLRSDSRDESDHEARWRAPTPALRFSALQKSPPTGTACREAPSAACRPSHAERVPQGRGRGCVRGASEAPRSAGLVAARVSALRHRTRRDCLSAESEANEASFATGHETEHRRGVRPQGGPPKLSPGRTPARGLAATTVADVQTRHEPRSAPCRKRPPVPRARPQP